MASDAFNKLRSFLSTLEQARIRYTLEHNRDEAIMVIPVVPGERWEIEFFQDGSIEVEVFRSDGSILGEDKMKQFIAQHCDPGITQ